MSKHLSYKVMLSCFLAGCLEIYDFTIFGFLSTVIYKNYLSFLNPEDAQIVAYGFFAVGFLFRPMGSILFGYIGDKYGRKRALVMSVSMMGGGALFMAALPSYANIGIISCYIIVLIRALQGISVGGEYSGAIIYAIEHHPKKRAGFIGAIVVSGCLSGVMLARLVSNVLQSPDLPEYSWRLAFLLGFILSLIGFFIRNNLSETPEFVALSKERSTNKRMPLLEGIASYPLAMVSSTLLVGANGVSFYFVVIFLMDYIKNTNGIDIGHISLLPTIIPALLAPVIGAISDHCNRHKMLLWGVALLGLYCVVTLPIVFVVKDIISIAYIVLGYAILFSIQSGTVNTFSVEIFPAQYRFSCGALSYAIGMACIGGTSPMVAAYLSSTEGGIYNVVIYVLIISTSAFSVGMLSILRGKILRR